MADFLALAFLVGVMWVVSQPRRRPSRSMGNPLDRPPARIFTNIPYQQKPVPPMTYPVWGDPRLGFVEIPGRRVVPREVAAYYWPDEVPTNVVITGIRHDA